MRLIDADKLVETIVNTPSEVAKIHTYNVLTSLAERQNEILDIVENSPTIEATPVVHGRWIGPTRVDANNNKYECSECGFWGVPGWAACPKCTAKMDGGVSDG